MSEWTPPTGWTRVTAIDSHTAGEPFRVVAAGVPKIPGETMLAKRHHADEQLDHLRRVLMLEPRGHADMYGCFLTQPVTAGAAFGALFLHNDGFSTMCGHGIIALATVATTVGLVPTTPPETTLVIDTPAGPVTAVATHAEVGIESVRFQNVPSFLAARDHSVNVPGLGSVRYDLAYGGAFYAFVEADAVGLVLDPANAGALREAGMAIKQAVTDKAPIEHPTAADLGFLYGTIFVGPAEAPANHSRQVCIFADGQIDRSPTGTGVSARVAMLSARGRLALGEPISVESILGTTFVGRALSETSVGPHEAVVPQVEGAAYITGRHEFLVDPRDPLRDGFLVR